MFNNATKKNRTGYLTKKEKTPINSWILDENIIVGEIPIKSIIKGQKNQNNNS